MSQVSRRQFLKGSALFATSLGVFAIAGCGGNGSSSAAAAGDLKLVVPGKLTCISNLFFPPFESMNESTGDPEGFDIDISKALAEHMGLEVNWLPSQKFDNLVPTIKSGGTADIAIAGMTITPERQEEVNMSDPYIDSNQSIVIKKGSGETVESIDDPAKKGVAVQEGTTGQMWAEENFTKAKIVKVDDVIEGMSGLKSDYYHAVVCDLPVSKYQLQNYADLEILEEIPTGEQYGIAVSKDNPELTKAINDALSAMEKDGTMTKLKQDWFGSDQF